MIGKLMVNVRNGGPAPAQNPAVERTRLVARSWRGRICRAVLTSAAIAYWLTANPSVEVAAQSLQGSTNLASTATVIDVCTVSTSAVALGTYDPIVTHAAAPLLASGAVTITCLPGAVTPIGLDLGAHASGTTRRMFNSAASAYLTYELYKDAGRIQVWGNTGTDRLTPVAAPNGNPRSFTVYGRVPAGQDAPAGSYVDTVLATVYF